MTQDLGSRWPTGLARVFGRGLGSVLLALAPSPASADDFARFEGPYLFEFAHARQARASSAMTIRELNALPDVVRDARSPLVVVTTGDGHLAKMIVSSALRRLKPNENQGPLVSVLVIERFETIDAADHASLKARGRGVILFDGFEYDLDTGQVVPEGAGGDVMFVAQGVSGPRMVALGKSRLLAVDKPPPAVASDNGPSPGREVRPGDFAGRFSLFANGQWSGMVDLKIDHDAVVTGRFRSDLDGAVYPIEGAVDPALPRKIVFTIQFPRSAQKYEGLLWTEGKGVIAGTMTMQEHPYGFMAIREGSSLAPPGVEVESPHPARLAARRVVVTILGEPDRYRMDGAVLSGEELTTALKAIVGERPSAHAIVRASGEIAYDRVRGLLLLIEQAGVQFIRLAPSTNGDGPATKPR